MKSAYIRLLIVIITICVAFAYKQKPKEICNTLQPHAWGYKRSVNGKHKTADKVMDILHQMDSIGAYLLMNIGPLPDGSFPEEDIITLKEVGRRLKESPIW